MLMVCGKIYDARTLIVGKVFVFVLFFTKRNERRTDNPSTRQAKFYQAKRYNKTIKDIPAFLEIIVRIHGNNFQKHFCCKDPSENLRSKQSYSNSIR